MEVKRILISQPEPKGTSPYAELAVKHKIQFDFQPFFQVEGVTSRDFTAQRVNILDYTAIIFTSRTAIDAFFKICQEQRVAVPETMKYFCQSEAIAVYLQKYIVYRKRKIFFGNGKVDSIIDAIGTKHKGEYFLITCTDNLKPDVEKLFTKAKLRHGSAVFVRTVNNDIHAIDLNSYQMVVFYSPGDVKSLQENFPDFKQDGLLFATYGVTTAKAAKEAGLELAIEAPTPETPSIAEAITKFITAK